MFIQRYKKTLFVVGIVAGLFLCVWIILLNTLLSCSTYQCLSFPDKNLWKIQTIYQKDNTAWRGLFAHHDYLVRLERISHISPEQFTELTNIRIMQTQGLFDTVRSPYPGVITDKIVCDTKYKPRPNTLITTSGITITYYSAFLNDRLQYGNCTDDQITHKGYTALFYCPQTNDWYQIELIVPKEKVATDSSYITLFKQIGCQRPSLNTGKLLP